MKRILWVFALMLCVFRAQAADLPEPVAQALQVAGIPASAVGIEVRAVGVTEPLLTLHADTAMNPASTMKLLTTMAALDLLGPAHSWKTEAYLGGALKDGVLDGDLILKGYGDPKLTVERFWLWLAELRARGLREIRGDLVLDRSYFDLLPHDPAEFDNDPVRAYNVGPDALLLNFNTLHLRYFPQGGQLKLVTEPPLDGVRLDNKLAPAKGARCDDWDDRILVQPEGDHVVFEGGYPAVCGERDHNLSLMPHPQYVHAVFRALWKSLGGTLQGGLREGKAAADAQPFSTLTSEPLQNLVQDINKYSNNVMARQLYLALGADTQASLSRSRRVLADWLTRNGMDFSELVVENGAGLSRNARITPAHLAQVLQYAARHPYSAELQASLPILGVDGTVKKRLRETPASGHAHLKTGTLEGVKTIAGYVRSRSGQDWVVVCLINHPNAKRGQAAQDALVEWVQQR